MKLPKNFMQKSVFRFVIFAVPQKKFLQINMAYLKLLLKIIRNLYETNLFNFGNVFIVMCYLSQI